MKSVLLIRSFRFFRKAFPPIQQCLFGNFNSKYIVKKKYPTIFFYPLPLLYTQLTAANTLLGEASIQTYAIAQKYRKMPMCKTGTVELRLF